MLLLFHLAVAVSSMAYTTYLYIKPATRRFYISYSLIALTLISGTVLVVSTHSNMLSACTSGLLYLAAVSAGLMAAHRRLIRSE